MSLSSTFFFAATWWTFVLVASAANCPSENKGSAARDVMMAFLNNDASDERNNVNRRFACLYEYVGELRDPLDLQMLDYLRDVKRFKSTSPADKSLASSIWDVYVNEGAAIRWQRAGSSSISWDKRKAIKSLIDSERPISQGIFDECTKSIVRIVQTVDTGSDTFVNYMDMDTEKKKTELPRSKCLEFCCEKEDACLSSPIASAGGLRGPTSANEGVEEAAEFVGHSDHFYDNDKADPSHRFRKCVATLGAFFVLPKSTPKADDQALKGEVRELLPPPNGKKLLSDLTTLRDRYRQDEVSFKVITDDELRKYVCSGAAGVGDPRPEFFTLLQFLIDAEARRAVTAKRAARKLGGLVDHQHRLEPLASRGPTLLMPTYRVGQSVDIKLADPSGYLSPQWHKGAQVSEVNGDGTYTVVLPHGPPKVNVPPADLRRDAFTAKPRAWSSYEKERDRLAAKAFAAAGVEGERLIVFSEIKSSSRLSTTNGESRSGGHVTREPAVLSSSFARWEGSFTSFSDFFSAARNFVYEYHGIDAFSVENKRKADEFVHELLHQLDDWPDVPPQLTKALALYDKGLHDPSDRIEGIPFQVVQLLWSSAKGYSKTDDAKRTDEFCGMLSKAFWNRDESSKLAIIAFSFVTPLRDHAKTLTFDDVKDHETTQNGIVEKTFSMTRSEEDDILLFRGGSLPIDHFHYFSELAGTAVDDFTRWKFKKYEDRKDSPSAGRLLSAMREAEDDESAEPMSNKKWRAQNIIAVSTSRQIAKDFMSKARPDFKTATVFWTFKLTESQFTSAMQAGYLDPMFHSFVGMEEELLFMPFTPFEVESFTLTSKNGGLPHVEMVIRCLTNAAVDEPIPIAKWS